MKGAAVPPYLFSLTCFTLPYPQTAQVLHCLLLINNVGQWYRDIAEGVGYTQHLAVVQSPSLVILKGEGSFRTRYHRLLKDGAAPPSVCRESKRGDRCMGKDHRARGEVRQITEEADVA